MRALRLVIIFVGLVAVGAAYAITPSERAILLSAQQFTYYVDSVNGKDSNSGKSIGQALKNLSALPTLKSGQRVCLVGGSYWRQLPPVITSGSVSNTLISNCGGGASPTIDASDDISGTNGGSWTATGGLTVTYQKSSLTFPANYSIGTPNIRVFENGIYLAYKTTTAAVDATAGSFTVDNMSAVSGIVYVHASDDSNPASNGKTYEYTSRPGVFWICGASCTFSGFTMKRSGVNDGMMSLQGDGASNLVQGMTLIQGTRHSLVMTCGAAGGVINTTFSDIYDPSSDGSASMLTFFESNGSGTPCNANGLTFSQGSTNTAATIATENTPALGTWHTGNLANLGNISLNGITATGTDGSQLSGFSGSQSPTWSVNGGVFSEMQNVVNVAAGQTATVTGAKYKSTSGQTQNYFGQLSGSGASLSLSGVNLCASNINQGMIRHTSSGGTLSISNSTMYAQSSQNSTVSLIFDTAGTLTWSANGNMIDTTQHGGSWAWNGNATGETYTGNNNHFPGVAKWTLNNTTATTLSAWQTNSGQDANSDTSGSGAAACN